MSSKVGRSKDAAIAGESAAGGRHAQHSTQAQRLIDLAFSAALFHTPDNIAYADIQVNGHRETWLLESKRFEGWLKRGFFVKFGKPPSPQALKSALAQLEAAAQFDSPKYSVCLRVGGHHGCLYLDLADDDWRAVEIDADGWRLIDNPPVRFRRRAGMRPLPVPIPGGNIETLRRFLNV